MQVISTKDNLSKGLNAVNKAVATRSIMPVLSNILINAVSDGLILTATDLEIAVEAKIDAEVMEKGSITLPAKSLSEIIAKLPEPFKVNRKDKETDDEYNKRLEKEESKYKINLNLNEEKNFMHISCFKSDYDLQTLPAEDFPLIPRITNEKIMTINKETLAQSIKQTRFATSTEVNKGILNGVHLHIKSGHIEMVSTDGYRLSMKTWQEKDIKGKEISVTVPAKAMAELERILNSSEDTDLNFAIVSNHVVVQLNNKLFSARILEGNYPDYHKIIPKTFERKINMVKSVFFSAVERASIVASEQTNVIRLSIDPEKSEMTIKADTPDLGKAVEIIEIEAEEDVSPINIIFNAKFLIDALRYIEADKVTFCMNGEVSPTLLYNSEYHFGDKDEYPSYLCMIMPIKPQAN